jgi:hypothetical protein
MTGIILFCEHHADSTIKVQVFYDRREQVFYAEWAKEKYTGETEAEVREQVGVAIKAFLDVPWMPTIAGSTYPFWSQRFKCITENKLRSQENGLSVCFPIPVSSLIERKQAMHIVRTSQTVKVEVYALTFEWKAMPGAGFSFTCDKKGTLLRDTLPALAQENLEKCLSGEFAVTSQGVKDYSYTYLEPAQGCCSCGRIVELADFTNTCDCGLEYNSSGQLLAPRSQWEEPWDDDGLRAWDDGIEAFEYAGGL